MKKANRFPYADVIVAGLSIAALSFLVSSCHAEEVATVNADTTSPEYNPRSNESLCREVEHTVNESHLEPEEAQRIVDRCWAWAAGNLKG